MNDKPKLMICPNDEKIEILKRYNQDKKLHSTKFMTKEEFFKKYYFDYSYQTLFYLMKKYNFQLDVAKLYLKYLYVIDENTSYHSEKLELLKEIKKDLIENHYLEYSKSFSKTISNMDIIVNHYYDLDLYEEKVLHTNFDIKEVVFSPTVLSFPSMEEEITYICCEIRKLLNKGISLSHIYLGNVTSNYYYTIEKIFKYFQIPIDIPYQKSIYTTKIIQDYFETGVMDLEDSKKLPIYHQLISCMEKLNGIDKEDPLYLTLLKDLCKHTYLDNKKHKNSIKIIDIYKRSFTSNDYVFVVGFTHDILPKTHQDIDYISDNIEVLINALKEYDDNIIFVGDGADTYKQLLLERLQSNYSYSRRNQW